MNKKQWCALKGALKDTFGIWGMLAGVFVAFSVCGIAVIMGFAILIDYLVSVFPILKEPIPGEYLVYGAILFIMIIVIRVMYIEIKKSYKRHMEKC